MANAQWAETHTCAHKVTFSARSRTPTLHVTVPCKGAEQPLDAQPVLECEYVPALPRRRIPLVLILTSTLILILILTRTSTSTSTGSTWTDRLLPACCDGLEELLVLLDAGRQLREHCLG